MDSEDACGYERDGGYVCNVHDIVVQHCVNMLCRTVFSLESRLQIDASAKLCLLNRRSSFGGQ